MDIIEMATPNSRSNMNAAVNIETPWEKFLEMLSQFTIEETEQRALLSGVTPGSAITKALGRGQKLKKKLYYFRQYFHKMR